MKKISKHKLYQKIKTFMSKHEYVLVSMLILIILVISTISFYKSLSPTGEPNYFTFFYLYVITFVLVGLILLLFFLSVYKDRNSNQLDRLISISDRANDTSERVLEISEKLMGKLTSSGNSPTLLRKYLGITSVHIFYIDSQRISALYHATVGPVQLQSITDEIVNQQDTGFSVDIKKVVGVLANETIVSKKAETSQIIEPSLEDKLLTVQSFFLRKNIVAIGYEDPLTRNKYEFIDPEININEKLHVEIIDDDNWLIHEKERLNNLLSKYIILDNEFWIKEYLVPDNFFSFTFTRPIVYFEGSPLVVFKMQIIKSLIGDIDKLAISQKVGKSIRFQVFGYVTDLNIETNSGDIEVEIVPYAVYI